MEQGNKKGFLNISLEECGKVYPIIQKNAETHFHSAKILANEKKYANAVAHLILGSEELLKSLVLFLESKAFDLRNVEGYKKLFSNHRARHSIIKEFYSVIIIIKKFIELFESKKKEPLFLQILKGIKSGLEGVLQAANNHEWWIKQIPSSSNVFILIMKMKL